MKQESFNFEQHKMETDRKMKMITIQLDSLDGQDKEIVEKVEKDIQMAMKFTKEVQADLKSTDYYLKAVQPLENFKETTVLL
jgi:hypothetical protein